MYADMEESLLFGRTEELCATGHAHELDFKVMVLGFKFPSAMLELAARYTV